MAVAPGLGASGLGGWGAVAAGPQPPSCSELVPISEVPSAWHGGARGWGAGREGHWGGLPPQLGFMCSPGG